jgi:LEA14-like dessication related protein
MNPGYMPVLGILLAGCIIAAGCTGVPKAPEVSVQGVTLTSFSLSSLSLDVMLLVNNPNSFGITLSSLAFDVYYQRGADWVFLSHGEKTDIQINPGENEVTVPVTVSSGELVRAVAELITNGKLTVQIRGNATPEFYGLGPKIPFTYTTTISP